MSRLRAGKRRIHYPVCVLILRFNLAVVSRRNLLPVKIPACTPVSVHAVFPRQETRGIMSTTMSPLTRFRE